MYQGYRDYIDEFGNRRRVYYRKRYNPGPGATRKRRWRRAFDAVIPTPVLTWVVGVGQELMSTWVQDHRQFRTWLAGGHDSTGKTVWCDWFFGRFT